VYVCILSGYYLTWVWYHNLFRICMWSIYRSSYLG